MNRRTSKLLEQYAEIMNRDRRALAIWWKGLPAPEKSKWRAKIRHVVDMGQRAREQARAQMEARKELFDGSDRKDAPREEGDKAVGPDPGLSAGSRHERSDDAGHHC